MPDLKFNTKIYKEEVIKKAVSAYSHLARFSFINSKGYIKVKIEKVDSSVKNVLLDEFANYVLGKTKKCL